MRRAGTPLIWGSLQCLAVVIFDSIPLGSGRCETAAAEEESDSDTCIFYQQGLHVLRSDFDLFVPDLTAPGASILEYPAAGFAESAINDDKDKAPLRQDGSRDKGNASIFVVDATGSDVVAIVRGGNETVLVNFTKDGKAVVTPNGTSHGPAEDNNTVEIVNVTSNENDTLNVNVTGRGLNLTVDNAPSETAKNATAKITKNTTKVKVEHKIVGNHVVHSRTKTTNNTVNATAAPGASSNNKTEAEEATEATPKPKEEKPFAKENTTVHKHVLNITRRVNGTYNKTQNVTITETIESVTVASPFHIASVYMILFVPVAVGWAMYFNDALNPCCRLWLLPYTMCTMSIGQDLVNQSLTLVLRAPNAITAIQAFMMFMGALIWASSLNWAEVHGNHLLSITRWFGVGVLFSIYQLMNHWSYAVCSLSERTVITNLSPLIVLALETVMFRGSDFKPAVPCRGKIALTLMLVGAFLFSIQSPSFTRHGLAVAILLLLVTVPYRLAQRHLLTRLIPASFPLTALTCLDGFVLGVPSFSISTLRHIQEPIDYQAFLELPVVFMLLLSIGTFIGLHVCSLAMLRSGSATTYLVFSNIASLGTVALGIMFFGDQALGTALACVGLVTNVGSGVWYSAEAQSMDDMVLVGKDVKATKEKQATDTERSQILMALKGSPHIDN